MSFEPRDYLRHILTEADYLVESSKGLSYDRVAADETLRRTFVRSLEIIGEAAKKVPEDFRTRYPEVEWRAWLPCVIGSSVTTSGLISSSSGMLSCIAYPISDRKS
jgi:uncharacterized protein with HEPN domain